MGKLSNEIYMDYRVMREKAQRLEELAAELRTVAQNQVGYYCGNLNFWKGDSGDICRQKLRKLENNLNKQAKDLQHTASALRSAAERQYRLEMALKSLVSD